MPKWDKTRNYYADLELPPSATSDDIKKQFKKLALKWHPDRNPGREAEVNAKFQTIQSAHEILSDETLRRQYDEARRPSSRYPAASGVKGNPWQDVAKNFPTPPTRRPPNSQPRPASGAQRYENFAGSMPRNNRMPPKDDSQFRRSNADAWDNIRPNSSRRPPPPPPPNSTRPPPPTPGRSQPGRAPTSATRDTRPPPNPTAPQTAYQKQKAQASFGTSKKAGFVPRSANLADEPQVTSKNYTTHRTHSRMYTESEEEYPAESSTTSRDVPPVADPLAQFREKVSTPYATPGGEKTNLFDSFAGLGLGRSTSVRTPEMPGAFPRSRPRASSTPKSSSNDGGSEDSVKVNTGSSGSSNYNNKPYQSRASTRYKPATVAAEDGPTQTNPAAQASMPSSTSAQDGRGRPSVYASQTLPPNSHPGYFQPPCLGSRNQSGNSQDPANKEWSSFASSSSFANPSLFPMEAHQRSTLYHLVNNHSAVNGNGNKVPCDQKRSSSHCSFPTSPPKMKKVETNKRAASSFSFASGTQVNGNDNGTRTFTRNSTENINTRFVDDTVLDDWEFKAGSVTADESATPTKSRSRPIRRQTPLTRVSTQGRTSSMRSESEATQARQPFSAGDWNEQIGSQHFEPQVTSTSPSRRSNSKKVKPVKMTAGTAGIVVDEEDEGEERPEVSQNSSTIPEAMDIDTPPAEKFEDPLKARQDNQARKVPIEPHRADWRAGNANGFVSEPPNMSSQSNGFKNPFAQDETTPSNTTSNGVKLPFNVATASIPTQHAGSEDTEEFRPSFSDFRKVEPFAEKPRGLDSFADFESTLPFESKPSEQIPLDVQPPPRPYEFPLVPVAPRLPSAAGTRLTAPVFRKYSQDFYNYVDKWTAFHKKVQADLQARQEEFMHRRSRRGKNWLDSSEWAGDGARDYLHEIEQAQNAQHMLMEATSEHQKRVVEFMNLRDRAN
ncbi:hypothetical protein F5Y16DRAFT_205266 [Xylariaceae sp. FL0255]|nr:hypothetical protein F5Y16DRAFT_205266 [Xylariaceae sp. FL0255]